MFFIIVIVFALSGLLIAYLHSDPDSYLLLTFGNISVETSLGVALAALLLIVLALWLVFSLFRSVFVTTAGARAGWLWWRRKERVKTLNNILVYHLSDNHKKAANMLSKLTERELGKFQQIALQTSSHLQLKEITKAEKLLEQLFTMASSKDERDLAMRLKAGLLARQNKYQDILDLHLSGKLKNTAFWREVVVQSALHTRNWPLLLKQVTKNKNDSEEIWTQLLHNHNSDLPIERVWQSAPQSLKKHPPFILAYIKELIKSEHFATVQNLLLNAANHEETEELLLEFGNFPLTNSTQLLNKIERIYHLKTGDKSMLSLALGKICLEIDLLGKAEDYLKELPENDNEVIRKEASLTLAKLYAKLGQHEQATEYLPQSATAIANNDD